MKVEKPNRNQPGYSGNKHLFRGNGNNTLGGYKTGIENGPAPRTARGKRRTHQEPPPQRKVEKKLASRMRDHEASKVLSTSTKPGSLNWRK